MTVIGWQRAESRPMPLGHLALMKGIAMDDLTIAEAAPGLLDAIKDLCRAMGYSRAWSRVKNDTAAAPIYDWLLSAEILVALLGVDPRLHNYRAHWSELVSMGNAALRVFTPAVDRHHEAWPAVCAIREAVEVVR